ncbi:MAG: EthD domain-containing protein [Hyphomicrobiaceae bacterium]
MIKSLSILTRKPELTHEAFRKVWLAEHAPMVRAVPEVKRYVLSFVLASPDKAFVPIHDVAIDAVAELWYESRADMERAAARPEMIAVLQNGAKYLGGIKTIVTEEVDIIA